MSATIDPTSPQVTASERAIAEKQWQKFRFNCGQGHLDYVDEARRNYRYFRGNGGQWADDDRAYMESVQGRKCIEINGIQPAVLTAVGEQIATRAEVCYKPARDDASKGTAEALTQLGMHILEKNDYPRREKQVYRNGLIKRRGYFDVRMEFDDNVYGEVVIRDLDPITVMPDIFSESYDPKEWNEVMRFSWLSLDEIQGLYGIEARKKAQREQENMQDRPFSDEFRQSNKIDQRVGFGNATGPGYQIFSLEDSGELRLRVIERQYYQYAMRLFYVDPKTGTMEPVDDGVTLQDAQVEAKANGKILQKKNVRRIRWTITTRFCVLHDDWSPYRSYTVIPFFYLFDYGDTLSMVDNAISPQDLHNKAISATLHYLTTVSNSGWQMEENQLVGMTPDDLRREGMKSGLVIVRKQGSKALEKITPNEFPTGMDRLADKGELYIKSTTGMSDAEQGLDSPEISGVAINAKQFQSKLSLADGKDNLAHTRTLVGRKLLELFQDYYTNERIYAITGKDLMGRPQPQTLIINKVQPDGSVLNDITIGEYDVEVSAQPLAATFEETQFQQALGMREKGVAIPDDEIVRHSSLANKDQIADRMAAPKDQGPSDLDQAKAELARAQAKAALASATNTNVQAMFGAVNAGEKLTLVHPIAPLADQMLLSAGFKDANQPPAIPAPPEGIAAEAPVAVTPDNTSPNYPPVADHGAMEGIEGGEEELAISH